MSEKIYRKSLVVFRRDLRIEDNTALLQALESSHNVVPCFIFDPRQVGRSNEFRSDNAIQFMVESLRDLAAQLKEKKGRLYLFSGQAEKVVSQLIKQEKLDAIFVNRDYTPFSIKRDKEMRKACARVGAVFVSCDDALLNPPENIMTGNGTPYEVFTAFWKKSKQIPVEKPARTRRNNFYTKTISGSESNAVFKKILRKNNTEIAVHGGTTEAKKIFRSLKKFKNYAKQRDFPAIQTTQLSAHLKFGTVSVRQAYHAIGKKLSKSHPLLRQLYWRDFYTYVAYHSPFVFGHAFKQKYDKLWWSKSKNDFKRWCDGKTGFPIVDAGMRQMNETGFMHNRVRMITASFLTKDLHINWLWGEKYFAQQLVDYDPAVNNGNWQWVASTGCDAQPYFRIFNPWLQQKRFDPKGEYIKKWIPELEDVAPKTIHSWNSDKYEEIVGYPRPMVDHKKESLLAKELFKKAK